MIRRRLLSALAIAALGFGLAAAYWGVRPGGPILVGFGGQFRGRAADIGVQGRNGAQLAVEEINAAGGVAGRELRLVPEDDGNTPEGAREAIRAMARAGVVAVVGHMTSAMTQAALPEAAAHHLLLVSPTAAASAFTGLRDNLFRVIPSNADWGRGLATHAYRDMGLRAATFVADSANAVYCDTFLDAFAERFTALGGRIGDRLDFSANVPGDVVRLAPELAGASCVVLCSSAKDAALLARGLHAHGRAPVLLSPSWSATPTLLAQGGAEVAGMRFAMPAVADNPSPPFQRFRERYARRYGSPAGFAAAFAYEAVELLADGLRRTGGTSEGLAEALTRPEVRPGIIGPYTVDAFGDVSRPNFIAEIRDGGLRTIAAIAADGAENDAVRNDEPAATKDGDQR